MNSNGNKQLEIWGWQLFLARYLKTHNSEALPINHKKIPKTQTSSLNGVEDGSGANLAVALAEFR